MLPLSPLAGGARHANRLTVRQPLQKHGIQLTRKSTNAKFDSGILSGVSPFVSFSSAGVKAAQVLSGVRVDS